MNSEYNIIYRDSANDDLIEITDYIEKMTFSIKSRRIFYKIYENKKEVVIFRILGGFKKYENIV